MCIAVLLVIVAAGAALGDGAASSDKEVFQPIGVGGGGAIMAPSVSPYDSNFMLISTDMGGCYRSMDGGRNWAMTHFTQLAGAAGANLSLRAVFLKDEVYWQGTPVWQRPVLKVSKDKGKTWTACADKYPWGSDGIRHLAAVTGPRRVRIAVDQVNR